MKYQDQRGKTVVLTQELGKGGEATVFAVQGEPRLVAKVYHGHHSAERTDKLKAMVDHPPKEQARQKDHVSICWPERMLFNEQRQCVGFLMPLLDRTTHREMLYFYNPGDRRVQAPNFTWEYLVRAAMNIAIVVETLHNHGYVVGDVNESNFFISDTALVTVVDCDSMQVRTPTRTFHCTVAKGEYLAPEMHGVSLSTQTRGPEQDNFALAVVLFLMLMEGVHPYNGVWKGVGDSPSIEASIKAGDCPYISTVRVKPMPAAPPFDLLPKEVQELFRRAFGPGHSQPSARPSAHEWQQALGAMQFSVCKKNGQHSFSKHLAKCPWCLRAAERGHDAFPDPRAHPPSASPAPKQQPLPQRPFQSSTKPVSPPRPAAPPAPVWTQSPGVTNPSSSRPQQQSRRRRPSLPAYKSLVAGGWALALLTGFLTPFVLAVLPYGSFKSDYAWSIWLLAGLSGFLASRSNRKTFRGILYLGLAVGAAYAVIERGPIFYRISLIPLLSALGSVFLVRSLLKLGAQYSHIAVLRGNFIRTALVFGVVTLCAPLALAAVVSVAQGNLASLKSSLSAATVNLQPTVPPNTHLLTCSNVTSACNCTGKTTFKAGETMSLVFTSSGAPSLYIGLIWPDGRNQAVAMPNTWNSHGGLLCKSTQIKIPKKEQPGNGRLHMNVGVRNLVSYDSNFTVVR